MIEEHAIPLQFDRISTRGHVDEQTSAGQTIKRRSRPGRERRLREARAHSDEKPQAFGDRGHRGGDHPGILARASRREQHAVIAELIGGPRDLREIAERNVPCPLLAAQMPSVAMGRQEPEDIGFLGGRRRIESRKHLSSFKFGDRGR
jgi:hypothetical protein